MRSVCLKSVKYLRFGMTYMHAGMHPYTIYRITEHCRGNDAALMDTISYRYFERNYQFPIHKNNL